MDGGAKLHAAMYFARLTRPAPPSKSGQQGWNSLATHTIGFMDEIQQTTSKLDFESIEQLALDLVELRKGGGRLFLIGVGGSAGNCGHAVNDFRKLCGIETYAPTDNVSELSARANDEGFETIFAEWLKVSRLRPTDAIFVLSVGGGDIARNVSRNIVTAVDLALQRGAKVFGIVGRSEGHTARHGDRVILIPSTNPQHLTPISESFQAVVWHCLVSHPALQIVNTKW